MCSRIHGPPTSRAMRSASSDVGNSRIRIRCVSSTFATRAASAPALTTSWTTSRRRLHGLVAHRLAQAEVVDDDVHEPDATESGCGPGATASETWAAGDLGVPTARRLAR